VIKKDNNYNVCKIFKEWLAKNGHRFHQKWKIRHYPAKGKLNIYFENVASEIFCTVTEWSGVEVGVNFKRRFWDYICDFECAVHRSKDGKYYCGYCEPPTFYNTAQELLIDHSFENFLEWVNEHFTSSHVLELQKVGRGSTAAILIDKRISDSQYSERRAALRTLIHALNDETSNHSVGKTRSWIIPIIKEGGVAGRR
jgi:hypothetical protein